MRTLSPWIHGIVIGVLGATASGVVAQPDDRPAPEPVAPTRQKPPRVETPAVPGGAAGKDVTKSGPGAGTGATPAKKTPLHPVITEILYAVPTGEAGDANQDGTRHVSGDEFVELHNPHDEAIQLFGYVVTDGSAAGKTQVRFVFPVFELPAHATVVVFNGNAATWTGSVGDAKAAPTNGHEKFGGGYVFTMRMSSQRAAFGNASDAAVLKAPDGTTVQRVRWGKAAEGADDPKIALDEVAMVVSKSSVTRSGSGKDAAWRAHTDVDLKVFSPGVYTEAKPPADAPPETPKSEP